MSESKLYKNLMKVGMGIEACLTARQATPALILIYSAIDTAGWIASSAPYSTGATFTHWADNYLLKYNRLRCSSIELFAARCGLVHTFTPDSRLSDGGTRRILYAWGTGQCEDLERMIDATNTRGSYAAVHVNDLYDGWKFGLQLFIDDLEKDATRKLEAYEKAAKFFDDLSLETVDLFLGDSKG